MSTYKFLGRCYYNILISYLRNLFVSSIKSKRVLILLDHGNSLNVDQLELTKAMGKNLSLGYQSYVDLHHYNHPFPFQPNKS